MGAIVVERKHFTCTSRESNPGCWIYTQTLYHVAVKAGFYSKAVEVYYIPRPCDRHLFNVVKWIRQSWYQRRNTIGTNQHFQDSIPTLESTAPYTAAWLFHHYQLQTFNTGHADIMEGWTPSNHMIKILFFKAAYLTRWIDSLPTE